MESAKLNELAKQHGTQCGAQLGPERNRAAEVLVDGDLAHLVRAREGSADQMRLEQLPLVQALRREPMTL